MFDQSYFNSDLIGFDMIWFGTLSKACVLDVYYASTLQRFGFRSGSVGVSISEDLGTTRVICRKLSILRR